MGKLEHGHDNIHKNTICSGYILSEEMGVGLERMRDRVEPKIPMQRLGRPNDVAELGAFLCADRASYINRAVITVDGRYGIRFA
jgi:3-oxoacyl-[acyl-carrier protein] reductase